MDATLLFSFPEGMLIEEIQATETSLSLTVRATHPTSCCPLCGRVSSSIHSHYQRKLKDASCAGRQVQLTLTVRRFYCRNRLCERKVFTERLPRFVEPWARMTIRLREHLKQSHWRRVAEAEPNWPFVWGYPAHVRRFCAGSWRCRISQMR